MGHSHVSPQGQSAGLLFRMFPPWNAIPAFDHADAQGRRFLQLDLGCLQKLGNKLCIISSLTNAN